MIPFETTDWDELPREEHSGESGTSYWRVKQYPGLRIRLVEYSAGYKADHWCSKGHLVYCLEGEFTSYLKDGSSYLLKTGMSYQTSDNALNPHLSVSEKGCILLIVDGEFLEVREFKI